MAGRIINFIFFGNYFVGLLAVLLSIEMCLQLDLPLNSPAYYILLFFAPIVYYTYAYKHYAEKTTPGNERSRWYHRHQNLVNISQVLLLIFSISVLVFLFIQFRNNFWNLPVYYFILMAGIGLLCLFYYGLFSIKLFGFNLRNTGWFKAFLIGFVWACCVSIFPIMMLDMEGSNYDLDNIIWLWFFVKNWMFCTVNAIMFDIKDYPTDANHQLRTFVVEFGLRKTIFFIIIPLLILGLASFCFFAWQMRFSSVRFIINMLPFLLTLWLALTLARRRSILYYLVVIDGIIFFKAICGIIGSQF